MDAFIAPGAPFHGEFSSANPSAPANEAAARFALYKDGSATAISALGIRDQVIITDILVVSNGTNIVSVFFGADEVVDAGERVSVTSHTASAMNGFSIKCTPPHRGPIGAGGIPWPKCRGSGAIQTDVIIRGTIYTLP